VGPTGVSSATDGGRLRTTSEGPRTTAATPLVYILAASHSGSTLLAMLLGSHPEVCTVGELKATSLGDVDRYRCSCRQPITTCPFWLGVERDMARRGWAFDITRGGTDLGSGATAYGRRLLRPLHRGPVWERARDVALALSPTWRRQLPRIQALNAALAACICAQTGKRVLVDSSKIGLRLKYLLRNPELDVRVIRLIRDGRAVALTYTDPATFADARDPHLRGGGTGASRDSERLSLAKAATEWRRSNEEADAIVRRLDRSRWTEARYETLCRDPEATLRRLFGFLGVDPKAPRMVLGEHHILGNGMRLDSSLEVRLDDRWRWALSARDLAMFDSVAGALNRRLGYR
jgi:Sulfotransferase family